MLGDFFNELFVTTMKAKIMELLHNCMLLVYFLSLKDSYLNSSDLAMDFTL